MEADYDRRWASELEYRAASSEEKALYFSYKLTKSVICTINFRSFMTQEDQVAKIAPIKSGEGHKYTQEGVIKVPLGFEPTRSSEFNRVKVKYRATTAAHFQEAIQKARIKVYFRGFPLKTPIEDISQYFSSYGKIEYLYLMDSTKSKSALRSAQGYVIYNSNDSANLVLSKSQSLYFRGIKILCELFQTKKKKNSSPKEILDAMSTTPERLDTSGSKPVSIGASNSSNQYKKEQTAVQEVKVSGNPAKISNLEREKHPTNQRSVRRSIRPYLKHAYLVNSNTADLENLRLNVCSKRPLEVPNPRAQ